MSFVFAREDLEQALEEGKPLFEAHWRETEMYQSGIPFDPNYKRYIDFNKTGFYQFYTVRKDGELVGDAGVYVTEGMYTRKKIATEDTWYLKPEVRGGILAARFLGFVEEQLRQQGVEDFYMQTKLANKAGKILELRGFTHIANQYWKNLACAHLPRRRQLTT